MSSSSSATSAAGSYSSSSPSSNLKNPAHEAHEALNSIPLLKKVARFHCSSLHSLYTFLSVTSTFNETIVHYCSEEDELYEGIVKTQGDGQVQLRCKLEEVKRNQLQHGKTSPVYAEDGELETEEEKEGQNSNNGSSELKKKTSAELLREYARHTKGGFYTGIHRLMPIGQAEILAPMFKAFVKHQNDKKLFASIFAHSGSKPPGQYSASYTIQKSKAMNENRNDNCILMSAGYGESGESLLHLAARNTCDPRVFHEVLQNCCFANTAEDNKIKKLSPQELIQLALATRRDRRGRSCIFAAAEAGNVEAVRSILENADLPQLSAEISWHLQQNKRHHSGFLVLAVVSGGTDCVELVKLFLGDFSEFLEPYSTSKTNSSSATAAAAAASGGGTATSGVGENYNNNNYNKKLQENDLEGLFGNLKNNSSKIASLNMVNRHDTLLNACIVQAMHSKNINNKKTSRRKGGEQRESAGCPKILEYLLSQIPADKILGKRGADGMSPLHAATSSGNIVAFRLLRKKFPQQFDDAHVLTLRTSCGYNQEKRRYRRSSYSHHCHPSVEKYCCFSLAASKLPNDKIDGGKREQILLEEIFPVAQKCKFELSSFNDARGNLVDILASQCNKKLLSAFLSLSPTPLTCPPPSSASSSYSSYPADPANRNFHLFQNVLLSNVFAPTPRSTQSHAHSYRRGYGTHYRFRYVTAKQRDECLSDFIPWFFEKFPAPGVAVCSSSSSLSSSLSPSEVKHKYFELLLLGDLEKRKKQDQERQKELLLSSSATSVGSSTTSSSSYFSSLVSSVTGSSSSSQQQPKKNLTPEPPISTSPNWYSSSSISFFHAAVLSLDTGLVSYLLHEAKTTLNLSQAQIADYLINTVSSSTCTTPLFEICEKHNPFANSGYTSLSQLETLDSVLYNPLGRCQVNMIKLLVENGCDVNQFIQNQFESKCAMSICLTTRQFGLAKELKKLGAKTAGVKIEGKSLYDYTRAHLKVETKEKSTWVGDVQNAKNFTAKLREILDEVEV